MSKSSFHSQLPGAPGYGDRVPLAYFKSRADLGRVGLEGNVLRLSAAGGVATLNPAKSIDYESGGSVGPQKIRLSNVGRSPNFNMSKGYAL